MKSGVLKTSPAAIDLREEAAQLRRLTQRIVASKKRSAQMLAATKMHDAKGRLKPQFQ